MAEASVEDQMRWIRRGGLAIQLVGGWVAIFWINKFHLTAPVVFVSLGYLAVVATIYNLWRTGAAAVSAEEASATAWAAPAGPRADLEKEKRTLLKAIKEAEFDHAMGKLSKADADGMIQMYRARAIEVIKELDKPAAESNGATVREQIEREVKARLEVGAKKDKPKKKAKADKKAEADNKPEGDTKPKEETKEATS